MAKAIAQGARDGRPDPELATAAATGERAAFEELYRRNVPVAWRVAQAVAHNPDDASDAVADAFERVFRAVTTGHLSEAGSFRPYLLTATRRAAIDISRRARRTTPTEEIGLLERASSSPGPSERAVASLEARLLVRAFRDLPHRWRSVLWLIEVEDLSCQEAATVLGLTPNNVAQLAVRARIGLRKRYLGELVRDHARPECAPALERFATYAEGGLRRRQTAKVDEHLRGCDACCRRLDELRDVGTTLRRSALPVPVVLGSFVAGGWTRLTGGGSADAVAAALPANLPNLAPVTGWVSGVLPQVAGGTPVVERMVAWASAGLLVLGVSAGAVQSDTGSPSAGGAAVAESSGVVAMDPGAGRGVHVPGGAPVELARAGVPAALPAAGAPGAGAPSSGAAGSGPQATDPMAPIIALGAILPPVSLGSDPLAAEGVGAVLAPVGAVNELLPAPEALITEPPLPAAILDPHAVPVVGSVVSQPAQAGVAVEPIVTGPLVGIVPALPPLGTTDPATSGSQPAAP